MRSLCQAALDLVDGLLLTTDAALKLRLSPALRLPPAPYQIANVLHRRAASAASAPRRPNNQRQVLTYRFGQIPRSGSIAQRARKRPRSRPSSSISSQLDAYAYAEGGRQPSDRRVPDAIGPRNVRQWLAGIAPGNGAADAASAMGGRPM
jgi:hypothetical protein